MLRLDEIEPGAQCTHKNTGLRYTVIELGDEEALLDPIADDMQALVVPVALFQTEFVAGERYSGPRRGRGRGRRRGAQSGPAMQAPVGPKSKGKIKKMVRDRGFGFIRGEDGKEVFFHRSGMNGSDYDQVNEGDTVEYVIQEGPRGARAEHVRTISADSAA